MIDSNFECAICYGTFEKSWSDEQAMLEYNQLFPECKNDPISAVCDVCYEDFIRWFEKLSHYEKEKVKNDRI